MHACFLSRILRVCDEAISAVLFESKKEKGVNTPAQPVRFLDTICPPFNRDSLLSELKP